MNDYTNELTHRTADQRPTFFAVQPQHFLFVLQIQETKQTSHALNRETDTHQFDNDSLFFHDNQGKPAPRFTEITTPAPHHLIFFRLEAIPDAQPTVSKH